VAEHLDAETEPAGDNNVNQGESTSTPTAQVSTTAPPLDAGDIDLALRYLSELGVLVVADPIDDDTLRVVVDAASWASAQLIIVLPSGSRPPNGVPDDAIIFEAPSEHPDGAFATLVGSFAAALDDGDEAVHAFQEAVAIEGWTPSED
jgi:hypothetical protein